MMQHSCQCPCCGAGNLTVIGRLPDVNWFAGRPLMRALPGGNLYQCRTCALKFRHPVQTGPIYDSLYDNDSTETWESGRSRPDWNLILQYIRIHHPQGGRVLDFGCYTGGLLQRLDSKYERHGVEINTAAAAVAANKTQARIWPSLKEIPSRQLFDVIIAADVMEHVLNPLELIEALGKNLVTGGSLIITTGDSNAKLWSLFGSNWWYCFYPEHIAFLSREWFAHVTRRGELSMQQAQSFQYERLGVFRRMLEGLAMTFYGLMPSAYLVVNRMLSNAFRGADVRSVPGAGVSADHILVVLTREISHET